MTALAFPLAAASIICSSAFQSLGRSVDSLVVALLRQIILLLPTALLLVYLHPAWTFLSFLFAESATCLVSLILYRRVYHEKILPLKT